MPDSMLEQGMMSRAASQPVLGRAGYALDFTAPKAVQWLAGGPIISISQETCTDSTGCVCCQPGKSGCCDASSELFKLPGAFTLQAWVNYRGMFKEAIDKASK